MTISATTPRLLGLAAALAVAFSAHAERPMAVDDAGTLPHHGAKLELGWGKDAGVRGIEGAAGYSPLENLELELNFARQFDRETDPHSRIRATGFAAKFVPLQAEQGLSAGIKLEYGHARIDPRTGAPRDNEYGHAFRGLVTWTTESAQRIHLNLGREWVRTAGITEAANTWGVGFDQPLVENLRLTLETFGNEGGRPDKQVGLRWEVVEGLKLSGAIGRGNDRNIANVGVAWEF